MNADALIGTVLGNCTLQKIIGQGGMGAVFLAQQTRPRRQVAVKVLLPASALTAHQRAAFLERFRRETDAAASLEHPNIVPVYEYGERDGFAYLIVPYISGGTLRDHMEQEGQLPLAKALNYLEQVAAALDFAHERGVVHRDIKPANILMTPEGRLLLTDFGLVKIIANGQASQIRLTGAGAPVGTPDYMSPEQVIGEAVDGRSDLYSLGIILYQMVTGTTPFQGETPMQIAAQQMQTPPSAPRLLRPDLPLASEQVMLRAMAKRPCDRYSSGQEFVEAFRNSLDAAGLPIHGFTVKTAAVSTSTGSRLFTPRGLFDPSWQNGSTGTLPTATPDANLGLRKQTGMLPAAQASDATVASMRSGGLLSRTGMFPAVGSGSAHLPAASVPTTKALSTNTDSQAAALPIRPATPKSAGVLPALAEGERAVLPTELSELSPVRNTSGSLAVPNMKQKASNTMKLTGSVKVVQVPVAGQPGQYVTGLLPVIPQIQAEATDIAKRGRKPWQVVVIAVLVLLVIAASAGTFLYVRTHSTWSLHSIWSPQPSVATHIAGTPNAKATATALAQATVEANQILSDPLSHNIHNLPVGRNEFFSGGAYHIQNTEGSAVAVVLPDQPFNIPNAYTLTMWEVKGDDTSNNNSFGMVMRFTQQTKGNKTITTFYSFEVVNVKGGEYRFYKYDDSSGNLNNYWTQLWHQSFGSEFHQGQGTKNTNTIKIYQNGPNFTFSVNGSKVGTAQDKSYGSGTVGMLVNLKGTEVAFVNMLITRK